MMAKHGSTRTAADSTVVTADETEEQRLHLFLSHAYGEHKSAFLARHGSWLHRGNRNRLAVVVGDDIAAYCATIPTKCLVNGSVRPALWWVDLVVAPQFRGRGFQSVLDKAVRCAGELELGFPNQLAAKIHAKHGWGLRDDCRVLLLALDPTRMTSVQGISRYGRGFLRLAAQISSPVASYLRHRLSTYEPVTARPIEQLDPDLLANVFLSSASHRIVTTYRDRDFIQWRYLESPFRAQLSFYLAGPPQSPTHVLVTRNMPVPGGMETRILDAFGDLANIAGLRDVVSLAVGDAARRGTFQVTAMASAPELISVLRPLGFLIAVPARFCWYSAMPSMMESLGRSVCHWSLADSDNDTPD